jgi:tetratricopeptide (TPR) repeat protein
MAQGLKSRENGQLVAAEKSFEQALATARASDRKDQQGEALLKIAGCQLRSFRYHDAMETIEKLSILADQIHDATLAGAAASNLASIYEQLADFQAAANAIHRAVPLLRRSPHQEYLCKALQNDGEIEGLLGHLQESAASFKESLALARSLALVKLEESALSYLGGALLEMHDLAGAEKALRQAKGIEEREGDVNALSNTFYSLASVANEKGEFRRALTFFDSATRGSQHSTVSPFWAPNLKGRIMLGLHRYSEALYNFRKSVKLANAWRREGWLGDETRTRTVVNLHSIYEDYIELAAQISLSTGNVALARDAFRALTEDRASSLREQMALDRHRHLPVHYYELLKRIEQALANGNRSNLQRARSDLSEFENRIGLEEERALGNAIATDSSSDAVLHKIQGKLQKSGLLLSYCLGQKSFVWAVSSDHLRLYRLASRYEIERHAAAFSSSTRDDHPNSAGFSLAVELFGQLRDVEGKTEWIIAPDGVLLENFPFSALPDVLAKEPGTLLITRHAIRILPSALFLAIESPPVPKPEFLGYGDPIYNVADPRANAAMRKGRTTSPVLARLVGSSQEILRAAQASGMPSRITTGAAVNGLNLKAALEQPTRVLHFAVHVVSPPTSNNSSDAALALTLGSDNSPELLTREFIATFRVPGTLVVLNGCKSEQGENLPSAGIIGLSRAWLLAGASAVVVSAWPTPDDSGEFFSSFYRHLKSEASRNPGQAAADALRSAQLDVQSGSPYRQRSSYWAAYSLISRE